ncbi:uncharacterized protein MONOS_14901 [Monocercomonoides exilis]|uniref:uncharacterized protein n=1 Tax=Monocercomonoides exilis TaxID=2049356 RepID=UPI003559AC96|nr:hypothetical protein MONOS_14901 [Monocercomonoides exilis]|eukprot:MONOS_14901.1-p1 / transcript=MONOS_14901.1 / gene=MONOS_14901 / organism=Monocercomonoides_exilis_PA203 / gene_product=unspecified product / transcript_product=unspecified product / location=Mono_scaffold01101:6413-16636(+) / protein_length=2867 / sequence_SO=supercontig / SO=protein_coding / is_pseudo=false
MVSKGIVESMLVAFDFCFGKNQAVMRSLLADLQIFSKDKTTVSTMIEHGGIKAAVDTLIYYSSPLVADEIIPESSKSSDSESSFPSSSEKNEENGTSSETTAVQSKIDRIRRSENYHRLAAADLRIMKSALSCIRNWMEDESLHHKLISAGVIDGLNAALTASNALLSEPLTYSILSLIAPFAVYSPTEVKKSDIVLNCVDCLDLYPHSAPITHLSLSVLTILSQDETVLNQVLNASTIKAVVNALNQHALSSPSLSRIATGLVAFIAKNPSARKEVLKSNIIDLVISTVECHVCGRNIQRKRILNSTLNKSEMKSKEQSEDEMRPDVFGSEGCEEGKRGCEEEKENEKERKEDSEMCEGNEDGDNYNDELPGEEQEDAEWEKEEEMQEIRYLNEGESEERERNTEEMKKGGLELVLNATSALAFLTEDEMSFDECLKIDFVPRLYRAALRCIRSITTQQSSQSASASASAPVSSFSQTSSPEKEEEEKDHKNESEAIQSNESEAQIKSNTISLIVENVLAILIHLLGASPKLNAAIVCPLASNAQSFSALSNAVLTSPLEAFPLLAIWHSFLPVVLSDDSTSGGEREKRKRMMTPAKQKKLSKEWGKNDCNEIKQDCGLCGDEEISGRCILFSEVVFERLGIIVAELARLTSSASDEAKTPQSQSQQQSSSSSSSSSSSTSQPLSFSLYDSLSAPTASNMFRRLAPQLIPYLTVLLSLTIQSTENKPLSQSRSSLTENQDDPFNSDFSQRNVEDKDNQNSLSQLLLPSFCSAFYQHLSSLPLQTKLLLIKFTSTALCNILLHSPQQLICALPERSYSIASRHDGLMGEIGEEEEGQEEEEEAEERRLASGREEEKATAKLTEGKLEWIEFVSQRNAELIAEVSYLILRGIDIRQGIEGEGKEENTELSAEKEEKEDDEEDNDDECNETKSTITTSERNHKSSAADASASSTSSSSSSSSSASSSSDRVYSSLRSIRQTLKRIGWSILLNGSRHVSLRTHFVNRHLLPFLLEETRNTLTSICKIERKKKEREEKKRKDAAKAEKEWRKKAFESIHSGGKADSQSSSSSSSSASSSISATTSSSAEERKLKRKEAKAKKAKAEAEALKWEQLEEKERGKMNDLYIFLSIASNIAADESLAPSLALAVTSNESATSHKNRKKRQGSLKEEEEDREEGGSNKVSDESSESCLESSEDALSAVQNSVADDDEAYTEQSEQQSTLTSVGLYLSIVEMFTFSSLSSMVCSSSSPSSSTNGGPTITQSPSQFPSPTSPTSSSSSSSFTFASSSLSVTVIPYRILSVAVSILHSLFAYSIHSRLIAAHIQKCSEAHLLQMQSIEEAAKAAAEETEAAEEEAKKGSSHSFAHSTRSHCNSPSQRHPTSNGKFSPKLLDEEVRTSNYLLNDTANGDAPLTTPPSSPQLSSSSSSLSSVFFPYLFTTSVSFEHFSDSKRAFFSETPHIFPYDILLRCVAWQRKYIESSASSCSIVHSALFSLFLLCSFNSLTLFVSYYSPLFATSLSLSSSSSHSSSSSSSSSMSPSPTSSATSSALQSLFPSPIASGLNSIASTRRGSFSDEQSKPGEMVSSSSSSFPSSSSSSNSSYTSLLLRQSSSQLLSHVSTFSHTADEEASAFLIPADEGAERRILADKDIVELVLSLFLSLYRKEREAPKQNRKKAENVGDKKSNLHGEHLKSGSPFQSSPNNAYSSSSLSQTNRLAAPGNNASIYSFSSSSLLLLRIFLALSRSALYFRQQSKQLKMLIDSSASNSDFTKSGGFELEAEEGKEGKSDFLLTPINYPLPPSPIPSRIRMADEEDERIEGKMGMTSGKDMKYREMEEEKKEEEEEEEEEIVCYSPKILKTLLSVLKDVSQRYFVLRIELNSQKEKQTREEELDTSDYFEASSPKQNNTETAENPAVPSQTTQHLHSFSHLSFLLDHLYTLVSIVFDASSSSHSVCGWLHHIGAVDAVGFALAVVERTCLAHSAESFSSSSAADAFSTENSNWKDFGEERRFGEGQNEKVEEKEQSVENNRMYEDMHKESISIDASSSDEKQTSSIPSVSSTKRLLAPLEVPQTPTVFCLPATLITPLTTPMTTTMKREEAKEARMQRRKEEFEFLKKLEEEEFSNETDCASRTLCNDSSMYSMYSNTSSYESPYTSQLKSGSAPAEADHNTTKERDRFCDWMMRDAISCLCSGILALLSVHQKCHAHFLHQLSAAGEMEKNGVSNCASASFRSTPIVVSLMQAVNTHIRVSSLSSDQLLSAALSSSSSSSSVSSTKRQRLSRTEKRMLRNALRVHVDTVRFLLYALWNLMGDGNESSPDNEETMMEQKGEETCRTPRSYAVTPKQSHTATKSRIIPASPNRSLRVASPKLGHSNELSASRTSPASTQMANSPRQSYQERNKFIASTSSLSSTYNQNSLVSPRMTTPRSKRQSASTFTATATPKAAESKTNSRAFSDTNDVNKQIVSALAASGGMEVLLDIVEGEGDTSLFFRQFEILKSAVACLCCMASQEEYAPSIIRRGTLIIQQALRQHMPKDSDSKLQTIICCLFWNIEITEKARLLMAREGGIEFLSEILSKNLNAFSGASASVAGGPSVSDKRTTLSAQADQSLQFGMHQQSPTNSSAYSGLPMPSRSVALASTSSARVQKLRNYWICISRCVKALEGLLSSVSVCEKAEKSSVLPLLLNTVRVCTQKHGDSNIRGMRKKEREENELQNASVFREVNRHSKEIEDERIRATGRVEGSSGLVHRSLSCILLLLRTHTNTVAFVQAGGVPTVCKLLEQYMWSSTVVCDAAAVLRAAATEVKSSRLALVKESGAVAGIRVAAEWYKSRGDETSSRNASQMLSGLLEMVSVGEDPKWKGVHSIGRITKN